ncbi:MAG: hypothetical protein ACFFD4_39115, partial [Candidatus Odinarchaeota archaeon]
KKIMDLTGGSNVRFFLRETVVEQKLSEKKSRKTEISSSWKIYLLIKKIRKLLRQQVATREPIIPLVQAVPIFLYPW